MYYVYTDLISFKPLGSQLAESALVCSPSDAQFQGYPCPPREVLYLAHRLNLHVSPPRPTVSVCSVLVNRLNSEITSSMTPENVIEEIFCGPPPCVPFLFPLARSLITKSGQLTSSVEGWKSSAQIATIIIFAPSCRRCLKKLPMGGNHKSFPPSSSVSVDFIHEFRCPARPTLRHHLRSPYPKYPCYMIVVTHKSYLLNSLPPMRKWTRFSTFC